jgi:hypothetical protein
MNRISNSQSQSPGKRRDQGHGAEQRDSGAVELHERQTAEDHSQVDDREDRDDGDGHRGAGRQWVVGQRGRC